MNYYQILFEFLVNIYIVLDFNYYTISIVIFDYDIKVLDYIGVKLMVCFIYIYILFISIIETKLVLYIKTFINY